MREWLHERALLKLVDASFGAYLTWDRRVLGDVRFVPPANWPVVLIRSLNLSQIVALLIERKRRLDRGDAAGVASVERFLEDHGYAWQPSRGEVVEEAAPKARRRKRNQPQ